MNRTCDLASGTGGIVGSAVGGAVGASIASTTAASASSAALWTSVYTSLGLSTTGVSVCAAPSALAVAAFTGPFAPVTIGVIVGISALAGTIAAKEAAKCK